MSEVASAYQPAKTNGPPQRESFQLQLNQRSSTVSLSKHAARMTQLTLPNRPPHPNRRHKPTPKLQKARPNLPTSILPRIIHHTPRSNSAKSRCITSGSIPHRRPRPTSAPTSAKPLQTRPPLHTNLPRHKHNNSTLILAHPRAKSSAGPKSRRSRFRSGRRTRRCHPRTAG